MRAVNWYIKQGQLSKDNSYKNLADKFLQKARQSLITMSILSELNSNKKVYVIGDGGIRNSGDCMKSLCLADMVMCGSIFAGALETPGNIFSFNKETTYKEYRGSSTHKTNHIEGIVSMVPTKGSFESILNKLLEGIRSGCAYQNVDNLVDLRESPEFIKITGSGLIESHPHIDCLK
jgi:IMP dehydrogenase